MRFSILGGQLKIKALIIAIFWIVFNQGCIFQEETEKFNVGKSLYTLIVNAGISTNYFYIAKGNHRGWSTPQKDFIYVNGDCFAVEKEGRVKIYFMGVILTDNESVRKDIDFIDMTRKSKEFIDLKETLFKDILFSVPNISE